jgi:hypothetical protein
VFHCRRPARADRTWCESSRDAGFLERPWVRLSPYSPTRCLGCDASCEVQSSARPRCALRLSLRIGATPNRRKKSLETRAPCRSCGSSIPVSTNVWLEVRKAATVSNERLSFWMSRKRADVTPKLVPRCTEKSEMAMIRFASLYGGGRNKTAFMTENAAVPIPIAKASTRPAKNVGTGFPFSQRTESRSTCRFKRDSCGHGGRLGEKSYGQPLSPVCSANSSGIRVGSASLEVA